MRILQIVGLCVALGACAGSPQGAASTSQFGNQYVGQNVTSIVNQFGKPVSRSKTDNDQTSYVWELDGAPDGADDRRSYSGDAGLYGDGEAPGYVTEDPRFCKMTVIVSREGIVTQVLTEDQSGTGVPKMKFGFNGSVCAQHLRARSRT